MTCRKLKFSMKFFFSKNCNLRNSQQKSKKWTYLWVKIVSFYRFFDVIKNENGKLSSFPRFMAGMGTAKVFWDLDWDQLQLIIEKKNWKIVRIAPFYSNKAKPTILLQKCIQQVSYFNIFYQFLTPFFSGIFSFDFNDLQKITNKGRLLSKFG